jgi:hypothetical protein
MGSFDSLPARSSLLEPLEVLRSGVSWPWPDSLAEGFERTYQKQLLYTKVPPTFQLLTLHQLLLQFVLLFRHGAGYDDGLAAFQARTRQV